MINIKNNYKDINYIKKILKQNNFNFKKKFGQNFLNKFDILNKIIKYSNISKIDTVVEIGAGAGFLTQALAENAKEVIIFEKDNSLKEVLKIILNNYNNITYVFDDFLNSDLKKYLKKENNKIVANLPYNVANLIIYKIISLCITKQIIVNSITIMLQKELAERYVAHAKTKQYGKLSVFYQSVSDIDYNFIVTRKNFIPQPKVDSAVITIKPNINKFFNNYDDIHNFEKFLNICFLYKRKKLINNLKENYDINKIKKIYDKMGLLYSIRAEEISINKLIDIYNEFKKLSFYYVLS